MEPKCSCYVSWTILGKDGRFKMNTVIALIKLLWRDSVTFQLKHDNARRGYKVQKAIRGRFPYLLPWLLPLSLIAFTYHSVTADYWNILTAAAVASCRDSSLHHFYCSWSMIYSNSDNHCVLNVCNLYIHTFWSCTSVEDKS